jgi:hypothetical protein
MIKLGVFLSSIIQASFKPTPSRMKKPLTRGAFYFLMIEYRRRNEGE